MTVEQAQIVSDKLDTLALGKAKGSDTAKLTRFRRQLRWALENADEEKKQVDLDKLELNFVSQETLDNLLQNEEDKAALAPYLLIIPQE